MKKFFIVLLTFFVSYGFNQISAQCSSSKKHVKSYQRSHQDIVDIAIASDVHTTLVAAVKAANLVETLQGDGPFTVFAPTNLAFERLPKGTVETLLKPANKKSLTNILTYHVVPAKVSANSLVEAIDAAGGEFIMNTVAGRSLTATKKGNHVVLKDEKGGISKITATDLKGTNGYVHVIDAVVLPK